MLALTPIENSELLSGYAYDSAQRVLTLRFENSAYVFHHQNVPPEVAAEFVAAKSKGAFFCQRIKREYEYTRVNTADGDDVQPEPALQAERS